MDAPIGAITIGSRERGGFSDSQIELLQNLRRAGGDRDHQRGDVSRVADPHERSSGNAGIPDRDQRRAEGHQPLDVRFAARAGHGGRDRRAALRCRSGRDLSPRGRRLRLAANFGFPAGIRGLLQSDRGYSAGPDAPSVTVESHAREGRPCIFTMWPPFQAIPT